MTIAARNLSVRLGQREAVRDVSFAADAGLVGVLGPNGAGKSTLMRALLGLVPHGGEVRIGDTPRASLSRAEIATTVAYLPQGQTVHWPVSVERLVALGRLPHLAPFSRLGDADRSAVDRAMARAEIVALRHRTAIELSGGERARVLLARALAVEAPVLIADEPLASLDPAHALHGMELLRAEADAGRLVLAVLHDLTLAARFCDRLLVLHEGALVADGTPEATLTADLLARVYGIAAFTSIDPPLLVPVRRLVDGGGDRA